jgi:uncharacterized protein YndB with AHSA1/START domain
MITMTDDNAAQDAVVIERNLAAPPDLIWQMWTEPEHFKAWYGPDGAAIPSATMDVRVGGTRLVCMEMETPAGVMQMWFTREYREVVTNKRLVYSESMSNDRGEVLSPSAAGMPDGHPVTTVVTVELEDVDGHTRLTVTHAGVPSDSGGSIGWTMALDKLADLVDAQRS